jgi:Pentapeptide repeats (8 copies)
LTGAVVLDADFTGAKLDHADFTSAYLAGVNFTRANLAHTNLADIGYDPSTIWPSGFQPPPSRQSHSPATVGSPPKRMTGRSYAAVVPAVGELVQGTNGSWMVRPPQRWPPAE